MRLFRERMYFCQSLLTKKIKRIMKELVEKIAALVADFNKDANAQAAGTRARKASLEIEKAMKEFRKVSLEESKK